MTNVFLERSFSDKLTPADVIKMAEKDLPCFDNHRVNWLNSYLSNDGHRLICWFSSPDAESTLLALSDSGADTTRLWPGTIHKPVTSGQLTPAIVVERLWQSPVSFEEIQEIEDEGAWCLDNWKVKAVQSFFSFDRKRMLCFYDAPDAESVRQAQRQAAMPFDDIWATNTVLN